MSCPMRKLSITTKNNTELTFTNYKVTIPRNRKRIWVQSDEGIFTIAWSVIKTIKLIRLS